MDLIVPVPLHPKRLRWRGFNQSLLLARQVSRLYEVPVDPFVLHRDRETAPQTQLAEDERRKKRTGRVRGVSREIIETAKACCWWTMFTLLVPRSMSAAAFWSAAGREKSTY